MRVLVLIPTFNRPSYLRECLASLVRQDEQYWRAIVYDDGGSAGSDAVVGGFDPRVGYIWGVHRGMRPTMNRLLSAWDTDTYACFLDDDDMLPPESLRTRCDYLDAHPGVDLVGTDILMSDGRLRRRDPSEFPPDFADWSDHTNTASLMFRPVVKDHPYSARYTSNADDLLWQYKMWRAGLRFGYIPEALYGYRLHSGMDSSPAHKATYPPGVIEAERLAMLQEAREWDARCG